MGNEIWETRPVDLYRPGGHDHFYTVVGGIVALFNAVSAVVHRTPKPAEPMPRTIAAVVADRTMVTPDAVALTLADPDGGLLPSWTPGAHIDVQLPSGRRRQYSLSGPPGRRTDYRIVVRRLNNGGGGSVEMHETLGEGDTLLFEGPRNAFHLGSDRQGGLFVIGGIGVTPMLPMIREAHRRGTDWRAVYAGRSREYMPLLDEVVAVAPDRVTVWADDEHGRPPETAELLADAGPHTAVYVCGPVGMLDAVRIERDSRPGAALHYERFSPPPVVDGAPFELELARSGRVLSIPATRSALDVLLDVDPTTPCSCRQGFCGTCRVTVLDGEVDHRGRIPEAPNDMLVCVSRARGPRVVIDR